MNSESEKYIKLKFSAVNFILASCRCSYLSKTFMHKIRSYLKFHKIRRKIWGLYEGHQKIGSGEIGLKNFTVLNKYIYSLKISIKSLPGSRAKKYYDTVYG